MVTYMVTPQNKITLGGTDYINERGLSAEIVRRENGFDTATVVLSEKLSDLYPTIITNGASIALAIKNASDGSWGDSLLNGIIRFPLLNLQSSENITLKCDGAGYGLGEMVCAEEYGAQSRNPTNVNLSGIIADPNHGIIPKFVNRTLEYGTEGSSGYNYDTTYVYIQGDDPDIQFISFPYKPALNSINDLMDLITALRDDHIGSHWIVKTDGKVCVKQITESLTGIWTKYYGNSQANATLEQGIDFTSQNFEPIGPEANVVIYYGAWRRPSSGDWAENNASSYYSSPPLLTLTDETTLKIVGEKSVKAASNLKTAAIFSYPSSKDAAWNFNSFTDFNTPNFNFYLLKKGTLTSVAMYFFTAGAFITGDYYYAAINKDDLAVNDQFYHFSFPVGPYSNMIGQGKGFAWQKINNADWGNINFFIVSLVDTGAGLDYGIIDAPHFSDADICRVARSKWPSEGGTLGQSTNPVKVKVITDDVGKDDSLVATDDSGLMAQMAYAELLRLRKSSIVGTIQTPMIKDALPGQWFHIHAKKKADDSFAIDEDMRATRITQSFSINGYTTTLELTNDLTNSHARPRYEDQNKIWASIRPEWQDRQASSLKAGNLDIRIARLEKPYA